MTTNQAFTQRFTVRWSDLDANGHMRNTAYMEYAMQTRFAFMAHFGFTPSDFRRAGIGPVVFREETVYFKEVHLLQPIVVNQMIGSLSEDGARFTMVNQIFKDEHTLAAQITTEGAWLNLNTRKIEPPPAELLEVLRACARYEGP